MSDVSDLGSVSCPKFSKLCSSLVHFLNCELLFFMGHASLGRTDEEDNTFDCCCVVKRYQFSHIFSYGKRKLPIEPRSFSKICNVPISYTNWRSQPKNSTDINLVPCDMYY